MTMKFMKSAIFIVWVVAIAVLSIIPHAKEVGGLSFKLTESGMVLHFGAYFVGTALIYWAFIKGPQITQTRLPLQARPPAKQGEAAWGTSGQVTLIRKGTFFSILISGFTIFLYSVVLEFVQLYLPYRTFNPVDIAANASGIAIFSLVWMVFRRIRITGVEEKA